MNSSTLHKRWNDNTFKRFSTKISVILLNFSFVAISASYSWSQVSETAVKTNLDPRILNHYTQEDFNAISVEKQQAVIYYLTQSYVINVGAKPDYNVESFDIVRYENMRDAHEVVYIEEKNGVIIKILPLDQLTYEPIQLQTRFVQKRN